jgi:cbb3-type cytochrome oxidase maturation protein
MSVMFILLPVALLFSGVALAVFVLAARAGQFDDLETPGLRILHDEDMTPPPAPRADTPPGPRHPA